MNSLKSALRKNKYVYPLWCATLGRYYAVDVFHPHLGGYRPGGDHNSMARPLYDAFFAMGCRNAFDVGCAEGITVQTMIDIGYDAWGVEGYARALRRSACPERIVIHDLTSAPFLSGRRFDLVWCCEVAEHIEPKYVGNLALTLAGNCGRFLAMTHALPGQDGFHHVNCQPPDYWVQTIEASGLLFDESLTNEMRYHVRGHNPSAFFARTGLVFRRPE